MCKFLIGPIFSKIGPISNLFLKQNKPRLDDQRQGETMSIPSPKTEVWTVALDWSLTICNAKLILHSCVTSAVSSTLEGDDLPGFGSGSCR